MLFFEAVNMLGLKFIIAFATAYDGVLYVVRPPNCTSASLAFDDGSRNVTWRKMDNVTLENAAMESLSVFKISVKNFTYNGVVTFKVKFYYPTTVVVSKWQTVLVKQTDVLKKLNEPADKSCCISTVVLSIVLLIVLCLCVTYFFICWYYNRLL